MGQDYGIASHGEPAHTPHREPARFLVVIETGGSAIARLFLANHEQVGEFDAGTEEVATMTRGLTPRHCAEATEWDRALEGHSVGERAAAEVYTLDV